MSKKILHIIILVQLIRNHFLSFYYNSVPEPKQLFWIADSCQNSIMRIKSVENGVNVGLGIGESTNE